MGIEAKEEYGGSGCNFMTAILTVEELSKVDAAVAALVDIHNTLVVSLMNKLGTEEQKKKYLTMLATQCVSLITCSLHHIFLENLIQLCCSLVWQFRLVRTRSGIGRLLIEDHRPQRRKRLHFEWHQMLDLKLGLVGCVPDHGQRQPIGRLQGHHHLHCGT
jgi:Acyl-CoA dehydrogenase, N-terminal domain